jgi:hypothetical protein
MFAYVASGFQNLWYAVCCLDVRGSVESRVGSRSNVCALVCVCVCVCVLKEWLTARVEGHPNVDSVLHSLLGKGAALRGQGRLRRDS